MRPALAVAAAVLLGFAAWSAATPARAPHPRLTPVAGADYVVSIALERHPGTNGTGTDLFVTYSLAKGDGAIAYEGRLAAAAGHDAEALRTLLRRTADEIADVVLTGNKPSKRQSSDEANRRR